MISLFFFLIFLIFIFGASCSWVGWYFGRGHERGKQADQLIRAYNEFAKRELEKNRKTEQSVDEAWERVK